jgi:steroid 5-alpha reductase family enzyme
VHWSFFQNLPLALIAALLWAFLAFLVGRVVKRHATIDVFWGAGFLVVYLESLLADHHFVSNYPTTTHTTLSYADRFLVLVFVALWSLRLSIHLALRQRGAKEDSRYVMIMKGAKGRNETLYALKMIYGLQGLLLWFVSIPLQWIAAHHHFDWLLVPGLALVVIGFLFEAIGDEQLRRFIADATTRGTTMNRGLWRYTRHPNYFGDAVVWCGFYVVACSASWGVLTILSPIAMIYLLTSLSGKPMLERKLSKTRAGYDEYVAMTSSFFPRPPKRSNG